MALMQFEGNYVNPDRVTGITAAQTGEPFGRLWGFQVVCAGVSYLSKGYDTEARAQGHADATAERINGAKAAREMERENL